LSKLEKIIGFILIFVVLILSKFYFRDLTLFARLLIGTGIGYSLARAYTGFAGSVNRAYRTGSTKLMRTMMFMFFITAVINAGLFLGAGATSYNIWIKPINMGLLAGGFLFGFGMSLSVCCASGVLTDLPSGFPRAFITLIFFGLGVFLGFPIQRTASWVNESWFTSAVGEKTMGGVFLPDLFQGDGLYGYLGALLLIAVFGAIISYFSYLYEKKQLRNNKYTGLEIEKQQEIVRRFKQHGTEKLAKRAASREKKLEKIDAAEKPESMKDKAKIKFKPQIKSGKDVLFVKDLSKSFSGRTIFNNIEFDIYRNDKVGIIGPNGIGKTTLFKILLGRIEPDTGEIKVGHNVHFGYYDQELVGLCEENDIFDEIASQNPHLTNTEIRTLLGSFLFYGDDVFKKIDTLSGGEKSRISLLKLMQSKSNMLLLDEPTNHLDIPSKEALEDALTSYEGTFLTISHDRYFLNSVCDRIFDMSEDKMETYLGNYDDFLEKKLLLEELNEDAVVKTKTKTQLKEERKRRKEEEKLIREEKRRLQNIESEIADAEKEKARLENMMCLDEIAKDFEKMNTLSQNYEIIEKTLKNLYLEWESLI